MHVRVQVQIVPKEHHLQTTGMLPGFWTLLQTWLCLDILSMKSTNWSEAKTHTHLKWFQLNAENDNTSLTELRQRPDLTVELPHTPAVPPTTHSEAQDHSPNPIRTQVQKCGTTLRLKSFKLLVIDLTKVSAMLQ